MYNKDTENYQLHLKIVCYLVIFSSVTDKIE